MNRTVGWFSCGAASAVANKMTHPDVSVYCDTGSEDEDNARFMGDCVRWFNWPIETIKSVKYTDIWDVWEKRKYISGVDGAPCTMALKIQPRLDFQRDDDVHIFGYTADLEDMKRAVVLRENWPDLNIITPLIEKGITKAACLAMIRRAGFEPPLTYDLGFPNANCIPCCKATSPAYWALVRKHYPEKFYRFAKLCRETGTDGVRATRIKDVRIFVDEIPMDYPTTGAIAPECDFLCQLAEMEYTS